MQSRFLTTILLSLCVARGVLSIPLDLAPDAPAADDSERENEVRINAAKDLANKNILKMEHVLKNPDEPGHQDMINAAFGTDPSLDMTKVKDTVQKLKEGPAVPIKLATDPTPGVIAYTKFEGAKTPLTPSHISFGDKYHSADTSDDARAATLIHEATHHQSDTGDNVIKGKVLPGSDKRGSRVQTYTSEMEPYKTPAELNGDEKWTKLRDERKNYWDEVIPATKDMHKAAEAYGQFSSMCGAAVSDAAVGLRRRAMADGNWDEAAAYLIRRQACSLPRKAAAGKDASAKKSLPTNHKSPLGPKSKSEKAASRVPSANSRKNAGGLKKQRKAPVGKSPLSRSKKGGAAASRKLGGNRGSSASRKSPLGAAKLLAKGGKNLKSSKGLAGSRGKVSPKSRSKVGGSKSKPIRKGRTVKGLVKGGRAKKAPGSAKRPLSRTSASQRPVNKKNGLNAKKNAARPSAKSGSKNIARPGAKKNVGRPTSKKGTNPARSASRKNVARPSSKNNVRRPVASKKNVGRSAPKNVARPVSKKSGRPVSKSSAQRQTKPQVASSKVVPKAGLVAKTAPKKVRRDLAFQF